MIRDTFSPVSRFCHPACAVCHPSIPYSGTEHSGNIIFVMPLTVHREILTALFEDRKIFPVPYPDIIHLPENDRSCSSVFRFHAQPQTAVLLPLCHTNTAEIPILPETFLQ